jgi:ankyrin repeat protein
VEACRSGQLDIVAFLISKFSPSVDTLNSSLLEACGHVYPDIVKELIRAGADAHTRPEGYLFSNILSGRCYWQIYKDKGEEASAIMDMLASNGLVIDYTYKNLWENAGSIGLPIVHLLLSRSPPDEKSTMMALAGACNHGHDDAVVRLLEHATTEEFTMDVQMLLRVAIDAPCAYASKAATLNALLRHDQDLSVVHDQLLAFAVAGDCVDLVDQYINSGFDVNDVNDDQYDDASALSFASNPIIVKKLLDAKADVNNEYISVLTAACKDFQPESVKLLLDAGARVSSNSGELTLCVGAGFSSGSDNFYSPMEYVMSALCPADRLDDKIAVINLLVDAEINNVSYETPDSALHVCIRECKDANVDVIIKALAKRYPYMFERRDDQNETPLETVITGRVPQSVAKFKALIEAGVDVSPMLSVAGDAPLFAYVFCSSHVRSADIRDILRIFLHANIDVTACDDYGMTLLMWMMIATDTYGLFDTVRQMPDRMTSMLCAETIEHILSHAHTAVSSKGVGNGTGTAKPVSSSKRSSAKRSMPARTANRKRRRSKR